VSAARCVRLPVRPCPFSLFPIPVVASARSSRAPIWRPLEQRTVELIRRHENGGKSLLEARRTARRSRAMTRRIIWPLPSADRSRTKARALCSGGTSGFSDRQYRPFHIQRLHHSCSSSTQRRNLIPSSRLLATFARCCTTSRFSIDPITVCSA
jgi:hypothetical protein